MMKYLILLTILFAFIGCDDTQEPLGVIPDGTVEGSSDKRKKIPTSADADVEAVGVEVEEVEVDDVEVEFEEEEFEVEVDDVEVEFEEEEFEVEVDDVEVEFEEEEFEEFDNGDLPEGAEGLDEAQLEALRVFRKNDRIIVKDTIKTLNIRMPANGEAIGGMRSGETGKILSEAEIENGYVWFHIEWDAPVKNRLSGCGIGKKVCIGWSVAVLRDGTKVLDLLR